jgi:hypothetical protein
MKFHGCPYVSKHMWFNFHQIVIKSEIFMDNCSTRGFLNFCGILWSIFKVVYLFCFFTFFQFFKLHRSSNWLNFLVDDDQFGNNTKLMKQPYAQSCLTLGHIKKVIKNCCKLFYSFFGFWYVHLIAPMTNNWKFFGAQPTPPWIKRKIEKRKCPSPP